MNQNECMVLQSEVAGEQGVNFPLKWAERKLSLKGLEEEVNAYSASLINYRLTAVPCPSSSLINLGRIHFRFLWKGRV